MFLKIAAIVISEYRFVFDCGLRTDVSKEKDVSMEKNAN